MLQDKNCPPFKFIVPANNDNWFVYFETYEEAKQAYNFLREEKKMFKGHYIKARLKSRQSIYVPPGALTSNSPLPNSSEASQFHASVAATPSDVPSSRDGQESVASSSGSGPGPGVEASVPGVPMLSTELRLLNIEPAPNASMAPPTAGPVVQTSVPQQLYAQQNFSIGNLMSAGQQPAAAFAGVPFAAAAGQQLSLVPMSLAPPFFARVPEPSALVRLVHVLYCTCRTLKTEFRSPFDPLFRHDSATS